MQNKLVAQRYAKALIDLAIERNQLEEVKADIDFVRQTLTPEFGNVLLSPVISDHKKSQIFRTVFENRVTPLTFSFFDLVFSKRREWILREIAEEFHEKYRELKGIEIIEITTAVEISDELKHNIRTRFQNLPRFQNKTVEVKSKVDENILGGFIAQSHDILFDASIRNDLQYIGKQFLENLYVQRIR
ncbi:MAG TPA: ATP synthase F1 subunit delta [Parafilimonas sp.]|nr:ATP synthase F1 subunit delta [Parafilimonas sp.]